MGIGPLRPKDLATAFPERQEAARKLGQAIDRLGSSETRNDGVLQARELEAAVGLLKDRLEPTSGNGLRHSSARNGQPGTSRPITTASGTAAPGNTSVHSLFMQVMGKQAAAGLRDGADLADRIRTGAAAQGITEEELTESLTTLCKDPVLALREAGHPDYIKSAQWVARELERCGLKPLGRETDGGRSFLSPFRWEDRLDQINRCHNVVGVFDGTGDEPREAVLVIAHLDNLSASEKLYYEERGVDMEGYEGANDNTSCVAAVLEMAEALKAAGPCQRDVVVLIPSAEEEGLKGTEAFVMEPPIPLDRFVGAINLEMIGRNATDELLCFGGDSGAEATANPLYQRAMRLAEEQGTSLKPGHDFDDGERWWHRSDHKVTATVGIPSIMLHGRADPGTYHTNDDTLDKLNVEKIKVTARHLLRVVRDLANDPDPEEQRGPDRRPAHGPIGGYEGRVFPNVD